MTRYFNPALIFAVLGAVLAFFGMVILQVNFKLGRDEAKIYLEDFILMYGTLYCWGYVFLEKFKMKILSWIVVVFFASLITILQTLLYKMILPVPPVGWTFYTYTIDALLGGIAIYMTYIVVRHFDNE